MNKIGNLIKKERIKNNLTLTELSKISSIPISTLSRIENDKLKNVSSVFIYRLSKILNIDYEYITRQMWDILPTLLFEWKYHFASK